MTDEYLVSNSTDSGQMHFRHFIHKTNPQISTVASKVNSTTRHIFRIQLIHNTSPNLHTAQFTDRDVDVHFLYTSKNTNGRLYIQTCIHIQSFIINTWNVYDVQHKPLAADYLKPARTSSACRRWHSVVVFTMPGPAVVQVFQGTAYISPHFFPQFLTRYRCTMQEPKTSGFQIVLQ